MNNAKKTAGTLILVFTIKLGLYALSMSFASSGLRKLENFAPNLGGPTRDWNSDLISRFTSKKEHPKLKEYEYLDTWTGGFPGTVLGCYCPRNDPEESVKAGPHRGECSQKEVKSGCTLVQPLPANNFTLWMDIEDDLQVVRYKNSSYMTLIHLKADNSTCVAGSKKCADFCVPDSWEECPITSIKIGSENPDPSVYTESVDITTKDHRYTVYWTKSPAFSTITDLTASEYQVSLSVHSWCSSPGRKQYPMVSSRAGACFRDPRYESLQEQGESNLLQINKVNYSSLTGFVTSNNYRWYRFSGRSLHTKRECIQSQIELIDNVRPALDNLVSSAWLLVVIAWVFMGCVLMVQVLGITFACTNAYRNIEVPRAEAKGLSILTLIQFGLEAVPFILTVTITLSLRQSAKLVYSEYVKDCFPANYLVINEQFKTYIFYRLVIASLAILCSMSIDQSAVYYVNVCFADRY